MEIYINDLKWSIVNAKDSGIDFKTQTIWLNIGKGKDALNHDVIAMLTQAYAYSYNFQSEVKSVSYFLSAHFDAINAQKRKIMDEL